MLENHRGLMVNVGYKIPIAEVLSRINCRKTPPGLLREPGFALDSNGYRQASSGLLREPDSADNFNRK